MTAGLLIGRGFAGLPIDHRDPAIGVREYRVDPTTHDGVAEDEFERHLDVQRCPRRPRRRGEGGLQGGEPRSVGGLRVARTGQVVEVEQSLGTVEALHPVMERSAQDRLRIGADRQPAGEPAQRGIAIAVELDQRAHRQLGRQRRGGGFGGAGALGEQGVDVGDPTVRIIGQGRLRGGPGHGGSHHCGTPLGVTTSPAERVDGPQYFGGVVAQWVRFTVGGVGFPVLNVAAAGGLDDVLDVAQEIRRPARGGFGGAPVVPGDQQGVLGAGQRDVEQAALLVDAARQ